MEPVKSTTIAVTRGTGDVRLAGATLSAGDLIVIEQHGDVLLYSTSLSDIKVQGITGNVILDGVTTDSDTSIVGITGNVKIESSELRDLFGDVEIKSVGDVTLSNTAIASDMSITDSGAVALDLLTLDGDVILISNGGVNFTRNYVSLEDVMILNNTGPIIVNKNVDLSLSITENDDVTVTGNTFTYAEVSKNSGGVSIVGNTGEKLNCSDNNPAPTGLFNTITELADGQCAGF